MTDDQPNDRSDDPAAKDPTGSAAKRAPSAGARKPATRTFEQALADVEQVVARLESGKLDLGKSLDEYQRGIVTLKECHELLGQAERRVAVLSGFDAEGNPVVESFDEKPMSMDEKQAARATRRSAAPPKSTPLKSTPLKSTPRKPTRQLDLSPGMAETDLFDGEDSIDGLF